MIDGELRLRPCGPEETPAVLDLLRQSFGGAGVAWDEAYWSWKHERNPFGPSPCLVAEAEGRLVGLRTLLRWRLAGRDAEVSALRAVDTVTHPEWQGRGIFRRLTLAQVEEAKARGTALLFNTPNRQSRPGYLRMGWRDVGRIPLWLKPRRPGRLVASWAGRHDAADDWGDLPDLPPVQALLDDDALEPLLAAAPTEPRWHTPRDVAYLRWRYGEIPGFHYRALWRPGAALIFRSRLRRGLRELSLAEILVGSRPEDSRQAAELLTRLGPSSDADYLVAMAAPGTRERGALWRAGFLPLPAVGPRFTVRPLLSGLTPDPLRWASWRCSIGDLEIF